MQLKLDYIANRHVGALWFQSIGMNTAAQHAVKLHATFQSQMK
ncbi:hypothetical protein [Clostridium minihomine]|nr:hypothetical protein [Clostridium minihomine]